MIDSDSKILITGSMGFLGHHVAKVFNDYRTSSLGGFKMLTPSSKELNLLCDQDVHLYLDTHKPTHIIHLAAVCGGIGANSKRPGDFLYQNLMMTTNLIHACMKTKGRESGTPPFVKFVGIGTICSYPKYTPVPFKEKDLYNGYPEETNAGYGMAKLMQLEMLKAYRTQYGLNGIFLIPVNMAGTNDNFNDDSSHVIPAMLKKFHKAKLEEAESVTLWGDGSASREFLNVNDCAEAIFRATLLYNDPEPMNIGTGQEITIKELADKIKILVGFKGKVEWDDTKPNGQPRRCLDVSLAKKKLSFTAETSLDETLQVSYEWAQENGVL